MVPMIQVPYRGQLIPCDTPEEAAALAKLLYPASSTVFVGRALPREEPDPQVAVAVGLFGWNGLPLAVRKFAEFLLNNSGSELTSDQLGKTLDVESVEGIGPKRGWHKRQLAAAGINLDSILVRASDESGNWLIMRGEELGKLLKLKDSAP